MDIADLMKEVGFTVGSFCKHVDSRMTYVKVSRRSSLTFGTWQRLLDASGGPPLTYGKLVDDYSSLARLIATIMVDGLLHCSGPESASVVTFTLRAAGPGRSLDRYHDHGTSGPEYECRASAICPAVWSVEKAHSSLLAAVLATVHLLRGPHEIGLVFRL